VNFFETQCIAITVLGWVANPQSWGRGGRRFPTLWSWSTNVTDGRTDDMQSQYRAMHYCCALCVQLHKSH